MFQSMMLTLFFILPMLSEGRFSVETQSPECGSMQLPGPTGVITSPRYPERYPDHISCKWHIYVPEGSTLTIKLVDIDIEMDPGCEDSLLCCSRNWLSYSSKQLCGHNVTVPPLTTDRQLLVITFHSSKISRAGHGFQLNYFICQDDQFRCTDNLSCVNSSQRCDSVSDCGDGSDEWQCSHLKISHIVLDACSGDNMVPCGGSDDGCYNNATSRCDGVADCPNMGVDELNCGPCGRNKLYCKMGGCYPLSGSCDSVVQCAGGWDEGELGGCGSCKQNEAPCGSLDPCHCFHVTNQRCNRHMDCPHGQDELSCESGCEDKIACGDMQGCYSPSERCDRVAQCLDHSDEVGCYSQSLSTKFRCSISGRCVDDIYVCNDEDDCGDGSDEIDCVKNSVVTMVIMGSLACGMLAVFGVSCGLRYYVTRFRCSSANAQNAYQRQIDQGPLDEGSLYHLYREPPPTYHEAVLQGASAPVYCHPPRFTSIPVRGESSIPVVAGRRQRPRASVGRGRSSRQVPKPQHVVKPPEVREQGIVSPQIIAGDQFYPENGALNDHDTPMLELSDNNAGLSTADVEVSQDSNTRSPSGTSCSSLVSCESHNSYQSPS